MSERRTSLCACLPFELARALEAVPLSQWEQVQEVRLRSGSPLTLSTAQGDWSLGVMLTAAQIYDCFVRLCDRAVHTHQEELKQGFITTSSGFRVGVAGTAVVHGGEVTSYRDITSLCIRVPRPIVGCAATLMPWIAKDNGVNGLLLCGVPASGKTTLLRDVAQTLSFKHRVAVIDERAELSLGGLHACDVLCGCPKGIGILQAVRTLAPDVVIADEIGERAEWEAVSRSVFCGVPVIASVHARDERDLLAKEEIVRVLRNGGFSQVAFLPPRGKNQDPIRIRKAEELLENTGSNFDRACVHGCGG